MDFLPLLLKPWFQRALGFVLGAVGALAFAPVFLFPAVVLSLSCIWYILEIDIENDVSYRDLFYLGWWFGLGHFTAGLYWISFALFVDLESFWWLIPFALFGIPSILGIITGLTFSLTKLWPFGGVSRAFAFAALWVTLEWVRGHIFTGFPWNLLGYSWGFSLELSQLVSVFGVYGLSLLVILISISLCYLVRRKAAERNIAIFLFIFVLGAWFWGRDRISHPDEIHAPSQAIRIVQPNIAQTLKWDPQRQAANLKILMDMTAIPSTLPLKAVIWPESAVSFMLEQEPVLRMRIADVLPENALLFTGGLRRTPPGEVPIRLWNSLIVINKEGQIVTYYDKSHLVPFGEYIPFRSSLEGMLGKGSIKKITAGTVNFSSGAGLQTICLPEGLLPFSGLVCYEVIFPNAIVNKSQVRPGWIINVTNDGWYGNTSGPYQHLEMTRFRAIEEGIPIVRAANTGVSAVFDGYGQKIGSIGFEKQDILDVILPLPIYKVPFISQWGDWITLTLILLTFVTGYFFYLIGRPHE